MKRLACFACLVLCLTFLGCDSSNPISDEGMTALPSGVKYKDLQVGDGPEAKNGDTVEVHYIGKLLDGKIFDSTMDKDPFSFTLGSNNVIKGWNLGVVGMRTAGKRRLYIPSELAYGSQDRGNIPPDSDLVFEIALMRIVPPKVESPPVMDGDMVVLPSGVKIKEIKEGEGPPAQDGDRVEVHYTGRLTSGRVFDSSLSRRPFSFTLGRPGVIQGWQYGIAGMKLGGQRMLYIPARHAYGNQDKGEIPPNSDLIFEVKLMKIN